MQDKEVISILQNQLNFNSKSISDIKFFILELLRANKKHNFISKSTENVIWHRHVLDSAQLVKFIDFSKGSFSHTWCAKLRPPDDHLCVCYSLFGVL